MKCIFLKNNTWEGENWGIPVQHFMIFRSLIFHPFLHFVQFHFQTSHKWYVLWNLMYFTCSLCDWLIDRLIDWSIYWLIGWLIDRLIDWLIGWLIDWLVRFSFFFFQSQRVICCMCAGRITTSRSTSSSWQSTTPCFTRWTRRRRVQKHCLTGRRYVFF